MTKVAEIRVGNAEVALGLPRHGGGYYEDAITAGEGERFEENGVDQREDSGVDADAEGERADDGCREPGVLANHAEGVAEILEHRMVRR